MRLAITAAVLLLSAPAALADPPADPAADPAMLKQADALYQTGTEQFRASQFRDAIASFNDAYALVHDPIYLFNIAQAYRKVADCVNASSFYQRYLAAAPAASNRAKVEQWLRELEPCVAQHDADVAAARRQADAQRQPAVPTAPPPVSPTQSVAPRGPAPAPGDGHGLRLAGLAVGGVGLVGLAVGAGYAAHGMSLENAIKQDCASSCAWTGTDSEASKDHAGKTANAIATAGFIGGGVLVIGGAAMYYLGMRRAAEHVAIAPTSGGATALVRFEF